MKKDDFVHLHVHSDMSQLDGCGKMGEYVSMAAKRGNPAIAFTEHGTIRGHYQNHVLCEEHKIKPIYGVEFYVANDMYRKGLTEEEKDEIGKGLKAADKKSAIKKYEESEGIRDRWHLTCWAKNNQGLKNLYKLTSKSYLDGFYYKPRIDIKTLLEHGEGLHVATGCMSSVIYDRVLSGKRRKALEVSDDLYDKFGENFWIEVQPHHLMEQTVANKFGLELRRRYKGSRLLATQDAHYVKKCHAEHHDVLLCIGMNNLMSDSSRFKFDGDEFYMKNRKSMRKTFLKNHNYIGKSRIKEALDSTMLLSEMTDAKMKIDYHAAHLPEIEIPKQFESEWEYFKYLCFSGWEWRDINKRAKKISKRDKKSYGAVRDIYKQRLLMELNQIKKQNFVAYFLLVHDIYAFARENRIMVGPGRGSVAGSLIAFLIGISSADPIEHGLIFERFINPNRFDMPDIDMDFEDGRRSEIFQYLRDKYGKERCAQIATIGRLKGKNCLRDVSRVYEVPLFEVNKISSSIIERSDGDKRANKTIQDSFKEFKVCKEFNDKYPMVLKHAKLLEGMTKQLGIHAAGVVVAPSDITEYCPVETRKKDGEYVKVTAFDMNGVAAIGLVKLDVLGLKTLTVIRESLEAIEERTGEWIDIESLSLDDKKVLKAFTDHDYVGIFQYNTASADKMCEGIKFKDFEDIPAMTALNRPGPTRIGLSKKYIKRKKNSKYRKVDFHPKVSEIAADTLGVIVYQEHVIRIFTDVAGFSPGDADLLRRAMAKSKGGDSISKERERFIEGAFETTPGITKEQAEGIIDTITFFGSYGFNKSHATSYGMIAYWAQWLKVYYPIEFYCALLKNEEDRNSVQQIAKDAKNKGVEILPPDVSYSKDNFTIDSERNAIRGSLVDILKVGPAAASTVMENQPYKSFWDFLSRIDGRKCNKGCVVSLAKAGALNELIPNVKWFIENMEMVWTKVKGRNSKEEDLEKLLIESEKEEQFTEEEMQMISSKVNPLAFGRHPLDAYDKFIEENLKVPIAEMSDGNFFKNYNNQSCFVVGIIIDTKFQQIGDYHTGDIPSEAEMERMKWGKQYANTNIEDKGGTQNRVKFDIDVFDEMKSILDEGFGTPIIAHVNVNERFKSLKANFAVNLETLRIKGSDFTLWENIVRGEHPVKIRKWKNDEIKKKKITNEKFNSAKIGGTFCGVVTHVNEKFDKKNNEMAFFGITGVENHIEVICFSNTWGSSKRDIKVGNLVEIAIEKKRDNYRGMSYFYNGGGVRVLQKNTSI